MRYSVMEITRIAHVVFGAARTRRKLVTSVDKANVLEMLQLWRAVVTDVAEDYLDLTLNHMYVDSCAMALVTHPARFDVILMENLFGDILSDEAAVIAGSIGLLPSASLGDGPWTLRARPRICAGHRRPGQSQPAGTIASLAMLLRHSFALDAEADAIDAAIGASLSAGDRTADPIDTAPSIGCREMGRRVAGRIAD